MTPHRLGQQGFLLQAHLNIGYALVFVFSGDALHAVDGPRQVDGGGSRFPQRIAFDFQFRVKRIEVRRVDGVRRQADTHRRRHADGWGAANDHGFDGVSHVLDRCAVDEHFFIGQAGLIDHAYYTVDVFNCFNHVYFLNVSRKPGFRVFL